MSAIKALYKVEAVSLPFIIKIEIHLFGRPQEQVDPRDPQHNDIITQLHKMDGGSSGILKFNALHQAAYEHRDLREAEGARSSSSNSAAFGRGVSGAFPANLDSNCSGCREEEPR